jgi:hypothetical protein
MDEKKTFTCIRCGSQINTIFRTLGKDNQCEHCIRIEDDVKKRSNIGFAMNLDQKRYAKIKESMEIQSQDGNWNHDGYMLGVFNGMELVLSMLEAREPEFRTCDNKNFLDKSHIMLRKCTTINCDYNHADVCFLKEDKIDSWCPNSLTAPKFEPVPREDLFESRMIETILKNSLNSVYGLKTRTTPPNKMKVDAVVDRVKTMMEEEIVNSLNVAVVGAIPTAETAERIDELIESLTGTIRRSI